MPWSRRKPWKPSATPSVMQAMLWVVWSRRLATAIATAAVQTVNTLTEAGMTLGSAVANAAVVVGKHIVKAAETQLAALPAAIKTVAEDIGKAAVQVGSVVADVGELAADATLHLAGDILQRAQSSIQQGAKRASSKH